MKIEFVTIRGYSLILLLAAPMLLLSCGDSTGGGGGKPCTSVADCADGQICAGGKCGPCSADAQCEADYGQGAKCESGVCKTPECVNGTLGCPCKAGDSCDQGECVKGTCTDCGRGSLDCRCYDGGTCDSGLRCNTEGVCETCPAGEKECPCRTEGDECDGELICDNDVCIENPCPDGTDGCPCRSEGDKCDQDMYCNDDKLCAQCSNDIEGCPCTNGECQNDLVCDQDDKNCRKAKKCEDLSCADHQACQEGDPGKDATCLEECDDGWRWNQQSSACDELNCKASDPNSIADDCASKNRTCQEQQAGGAVCGACLTGFTDLGGSLDTCRAVLTCDDQGCSTKNRECTPEGDHQDAACGDCLTGFTDEGGTLDACRTVLTCDDQGCAAKHRDCTPGTDHQDAQCGSCLENYSEAGGECYEVNCDDGAPASILSQCDADFRECVKDETGGAHCGLCKPGYAENESHECQETMNCDINDPNHNLDCESLNRVCVDNGDFDECGECKEGTAQDPNDPNKCIPPITCADIECGDQFCIEGGPGENAHCESNQCSNGQAYSEWSSKCVDCPACDPNVDGNTGRVWPYTLKDSNRCICETKDGYYWSEGSERGPKPCDLDQDGWLRAPARDAVNSGDPAISQNARCVLRKVDRFVLENELGQRKEIFLCDGDPLFAEDPADCPSGTRTIDLYETIRNDDQVTLESDTTVAPYYEQGGKGRALRAEEVNSLTKACISVAADYNDNGISDISEWHGMPVASLGADEYVFVNFSYYIELYRSWYEAGSTSLLKGQYVISERKRCLAGDLALTYGDQGTSDYWRECTRSRDASYSGKGDPQSPDFGMDFARWSCSESTGSCPVPPPPTLEESQGGAIPKHGFCEVPEPPTDGVWRGMSHHSQFKCVLVSTDPPNNPPTELRLDPSVFGTEYAFNTCHVKCPDGDDICTSDCPDGDPRCATSSEYDTSVQPASPVLECELQAGAPDNGSIGFALVLFTSNTGGTSYVRGCIDEWSPTTVTGDGTSDPEVSAWRSLCPGWSANPAGATGKGSSGNFGKLQCGCTENYGGPSCDLGCPDPLLHVQYIDGEYHGTPREGFWMCGDFSGSSYTSLDPEYGPALVGKDGNGGVYVLKGEVPADTPTDGTVLYQEKCNEGCYSIR
ncbi:MAG: hypothetical protein GXP49_14425 [Deltaproteobacteria bacterium]|nr:hypothetical protein [Deltaproteobacteria bacterium]